MKSLRQRFRSPRWYRIRGPFVALVIAAVPTTLAAFFAFERSANPAAPPRGTVINALDGEAVEHPVIRPAQGPQIGGGGAFWLCNASVDPDCTNSDSVDAREGDQIRFKLRIHNAMPTPMPYAKFYLTRGKDQRDPSRETVYIQVEWPSGPDSRLDFADISPVSVRVTDRTGSHRLQYVAGSTALVNRRGALVARLPDGIDDDGIALTNIGSPRGCFSCDITYTRYVLFEMTVT